MTHEGAELRRGHAAGDGFHAYAEAIHVVARNIDTAFGEIDAHILPEVGELQGRAGQVGEPKVFVDFVGGHFAAGIEHKAAYWIG